MDTNRKVKRQLVKLPYLGHFVVTQTFDNKRAEALEQFQGVAVSAPEIAARYWRNFILPSGLLHPGKEHAVVVPLDSRLHSLGWHLASIGTVSGCDFHAREILRPVIVAGAYGFVVMHNHPSGVAVPSDKDRKATKMIEKAANVLGLHCVDHIIVPDRKEGFFSFRAAGLIGVEEDESGAAARPANVIPFTPGA